MKKKILSIICFILASSMLLFTVGCGGEANETVEATDTQPQTEKKTKKKKRLKRGRKQI